MSLYRAILTFPPEGMTLAQAADAACKLLATGFVTSGGILLETTLESSLETLGLWLLMYRQCIYESGHRGQGHFSEADCRIRAFDISLLAGSSNRAFGKD
jgi:hypothetical protein